MINKLLFIVILSLFTFNFLIAKNPDAGFRKANVLYTYGKYEVMKEYEGRKVGVKDGKEQIILRGFIRLNKDRESYYLILDKGTERERTKKMRTSLVERFFIPFRNST